LAEVVSGGRLAWLYQARRVTTNTNAAGGEINVDLACNTGQVIQVVSIAALQVTAGTRVLRVRILDEDNNIQMPIGSTATGASTSIFMPSIGSAATASGNTANSLGLIIGPGQKLNIQAADATGQANDTCTVGVTLLLFNVSTAPTWDKARSTNAADTTIAASTISAANTLQAVMV